MNGLPEEFLRFEERGHVCFSQGGRYLAVGISPLHTLQALVGIQPTLINDLIHQQFREGFLVSGC